MRFERILDNGRLWAVMYDGDVVNILERVFTQWNDYEWLRAFFMKHVEDLSSFFHITDIDRAVFDTVDDANDLECLIMDIDPDANLDELFRPLENTRLSEVLLGAISHPCILATAICHQTGIWPIHHYRGSH